jgi:hypothetical protein
MLPSSKPELHHSDNPVSGRVESRLNLGAHFQVAICRVKTWCAGRRTRTKFGCADRFPFELTGWIDWLPVPRAAWCGEMRIAE